MARQEVNRLETQAWVVADNLELQLASLTRGLSDLLVRGRVSSQDLALSAESTPAVSGIVLLGTRGSPVTSNHPLDGATQSGIERQFALPFSQMDVGRLYFSTRSDGSYLSVAQVAVDSEGRRTSIAELNTGYLREVLNAVRYRDDVEVSIMEGPNTLVASTQAKSATGPVVLSAYRSVLNPGFIGGAGLMVKVSASEDAVFALWRARLVDYLILFGSLSTLSLGLMALLQSRKRRFQDLERENTERLRLAYEAAEMGVWEYDLASSSMNWDPNMFWLHGLRPENYATSTQAWKTTLVPEDIPQAEAFIQSVRVSPSALTTKLRFRTDEGALRTFRTFAKGFPDQSGSCVRIVGIHQDITQSMEDQKQLKQLNLDLKQRSLEAEQASRSKSQFLANMSHEIRTPMNAVLGLLAILGKTSLEARQRDYVEKAESAGRFLLTLLNDVLDFSKAEAGKIVLENVEFDLHALLRDVGVILGTTAASKPVEVIFDTALDLPWAVVGDQFRLHQILLNLGGNAIKFTEEGTVTVTAKASFPKPDEVELRFSVTDTGIGIPENKLSEIFQGFVQAEASTTRRFGGSGLGLSISKLLIEQMGGRLEVESQLGQGSRFSFSVCLPIAPGGESHSRSRDHAIDPLQFLIVDDNLQTGDVITRMVGVLGWSARAVESVAAALDQLVAAEQPPVDVVLVDDSIPSLAKLVQKVRKERLASGRPVLVRSVSMGIHPASSEAMEDAWDGQISKPITPSGLVDLVETLFFRTLRDGSAKGVSDTRLAGRSILVVEDNPVNRMVAQELLGNAGADVVLASGGAEALRILESVSFDCILMDIQMPEMDGFQTTRHIRDLYGTRPFIIAVSANALPSDRAASLEAGMDDHIGKPLELESLVRTILRTQPGPNPSAAVDLDLKSAIGRLDHDPKLFQKVVEATLASGDDLVRDVIGNGRSSPEDRELAAHTLKGLAATAGATRLSREAGRIETELREGLIPSFQTFQHEWERTKLALSSYLAEAEASEEADGESERH